MKRKLHRLPLAAAAAAAIWAAAGSCNEEAQYMGKKTFTTDVTEMRLKVGERGTVTCHTVPSAKPAVIIEPDSIAEAWIEKDSLVRIEGLKAGTAEIRLTCHGITCGVALTVRPFTVPVESIAVTPAADSIHTGDTLRLKATVLPEDATDKSVTWISTTPALAKVDARGLVTTLKAGTARITAVTGDGSRKATATLTVTDKVIHVDSVTLSETVLSLKEGASATLKATVHPSNATDRSITWSSSAGSCVSVSRYGLVKALKTGTAVITAASTDGNRKGVCTVTVLDTVIHVTGITVEPATATVDKGKTLQLQAAIAPADASDKAVIWSSNNEGTATVSTTGLVKGIKAGTAVITATSHEGGKKSYCQLTVKDPYIPVSQISIKPTQLTMERGDKEQLALTVSPSNATDRTVKWTSTNESVAKVNKDGVIEATGPGSASIKATSNDNASRTATCNVTVIVSVKSVLLSQHTLDMTQEQTAALTAQLTPPDATERDITWTSSDESIATVSGGTVTAVLGGEATITATAPSGARDTCRVRVTNLPDRLEGAEWSDGETTTAMTPTQAAQTADLEVTVRYRQNGIINTYTGNEGSYASYDLVSFDWKTADISPEGTFTVTTDCAGSVINAHHNGTGKTTCTVTDRKDNSRTVSLERSVSVSYKDRFATDMTVIPETYTNAFSGSVLPVNFKCRVLFTDNTTEDRTSTATWSYRSSVGSATINGGTMQVSAIGDHGSYKNAVGGEFTAVASFGGVTREASVHVYPSFLSMSLNMNAGATGYKLLNPVEYKTVCYSYGGKQCNGNTCSWGDNSEYEYLMESFDRSGSQVSHVVFDDRTAAEGTMLFTLPGTYTIKCTVRNIMTGETKTDSQQVIIDAK